MPIEAQVSQDRFGIVLNGSGVVTGEDLVDVNPTAAACASCRYQLWDFSNATRVVASADAVHRLAIQDSTIPEWSALEKIAVVGIAESVADLTRIYDLYSTAWVGRRRDYRVRQFNALDEALQWLEVAVT